MSPAWHFVFYLLAFIVFAVGTLVEEITIGASRPFKIRLVSLGLALIAFVLAYDASKAL